MIFQDSIVFDRYFYQLLVFFITFIIAYMLSKAINIQNIKSIFAFHVVILFLLLFLNLINFLFVIFGIIEIILLIRISNENEVDTNESD